MGHFGDLGYDHNRELRVIGSWEAYAIGSHDSR